MSAAELLVMSIMSPAAQLIRMGALITAGMDAYLHCFRR